MFNNDVRVLWLAIGLILGWLANQEYRKRIVAQGVVTSSEETTDNHNIELVRKARGG